MPTLSVFFVLIIDREISRSEFIAIQLSHNAIVGKDDPVILKELWEEIEDIDLKLYAGLDTEILKDLEKMEFVTITDTAPDFRQMIFSFLPEEVDQIKKLLEETETLFSDDENFVLSLHHYNQVFKLLIDVKKQFNIVSNPTAFMKIIELAQTQFLTFPPPEPKKKNLKKCVNSEK